MVNLSTGAAQLVDSFAHAPAGTTPQNDAGSAPVGATPDLSTVVFTDDAQLTAGASSSETNLYSWNSATGDVTLLGVGASLGAPGFPPRVLNAVDNNGSSANIFVTDANGDLAAVPSRLVGADPDRPGGQRP